MNKGIGLVLLIIIYCAVYCSCASVPREDEKQPSLPPPGQSNDLNADDDNDDVDLLGDVVGSGTSELHHSYTSEEIEKHRLVTTDWYGNENKSTDEEVIKILEFVRNNNETFLFEGPNFAGSEQKRTIFGNDDRLCGESYNRGHPYTVMGYLSSPSGWCTGYLVGPRHLITAAQCVHPRGSPSSIYSSSQLRFYLRRNCYTYGSYYRVIQILTYSGYRASGNIDYDIACLLLSPSPNTWMGFAYRDPMPTVSGEVCGYPNDKSGFYRCFCCSKCNDVKRLRSGWWIYASTNSKRLQHTCDITGGMSGGPIFTGDHDSTSNLYSYGVVTHQSSSKNSGVRITSEIFYDICMWRCGTGGGPCSNIC